MKKLKLSLILAGFISTSSFAGSVAGFGGSTEVTQILNNVELVSEVSQTYDQLQVMYQDLKNLTNFIENGGNFTDLLNEVRNTVQYGQALAYNAQNLSQEFNKRYQGFEKYAQEKGVPKTADSKKYSDWSRQNLDNVHSALRNANLQSKYFDNEAQTIKEIEKQAKTATGRQQLQQAGIEILSLQATQMIRLRQMIASDMQMQANYQASVIDRQAETDARHQREKQGSYQDYSTNGKTYSGSIFNK